MAVKKTTLKHAHPDGTHDTRTTDRDYTHVVVGRSDLAALRVARGQIDPNELASYDYYRSIIAAGVGVALPSTSWPLTDADVARATRCLEGCENAQAMVEKFAAERVADFDRQYKGAICGPWEVISWASSQALAEKASRGRLPFMRDIRVEAINHGRRVVPTKPAAPTATQGGAMRNLDALQALLAHDSTRALAGSSLRNDLEALTSVESRPVAEVMAELRRFMASYDQRVGQAMDKLLARRRDIDSTVYPDEAPSRR